MSVTDNTNKLSAFTEGADQWHLLFAQLEPQHVEAFYQHYQQWQKQQRVLALQEQVAAIEQHIVNNITLMQNSQPSPIALATLTRLQSSGVEDIDLLDTLLERGDTWLDHTMQLLERCEELDLIHDNYTEWCRLALDGAYDWLDSVKETSAVTQQPDEGNEPEAIQDDTTELLLLEKLMSDDETVKVPVITPASTGTRTSQAEEISAPLIATPSAIVIPTLLSYGKTEASGDHVSIIPAIALPTKLSYAMHQEMHNAIQTPDARQTEDSLKPSLTLPKQLSYAMKVVQAAQAAERKQDVALAIPAQMSYTMQMADPTIIVAEPAIQRVEEQAAQPLAGQSQPAPDVRPEISVAPIVEQHVPAPPEKQQKLPKRGLLSRILAKIWQT